MLTHNLIIPKEVVYLFAIADKDGQPETVHDWTSFGTIIVGQPEVGLPFFISPNYVYVDQNFI